MAELKYNVKRSGLAFAARVRLLASRAPDTFAAAVLYKAAHRLDSHYGYSVREKKTAIRQYIQKEGGTSSIIDITTHFDWHIKRVYELVAEMERENLVEFYSSQPAGNGRGRPARRIRLILNSDTR